MKLTVALGARSLSARRYKICSWLRAIVAMLRFEVPQHRAYLLGRPEHAMFAFLGIVKTPPKTSMVLKRCRARCEQAFGEQFFEGFGGAEHGGGFSRGIDYVGAL